MGNTVRTRPVAPLSPAARQRLVQGDDELLAAQLSSGPDERFLHAHLAGLRLAAAVVASRGPGAGRGGPRTVWDMLERAEPALAGWAGFFAGGASERAAVEAGRGAVIGQGRADEVLAAAEDLRDVVEQLLGLAGHPERSAAAASAWAS